MSKKYSMFIGRWQPLHQGHLWLINQRLQEGKNVCLAIRDVEPNENQPWTAEEIEKMVHEGELKELIDDGIYQSNLGLLGQHPFPCFI